MTVTSWPPDALDRIGAAEELRIAHISAGGIERDVAYVAADDEVNDAVDAAYHSKYGPYTSYVEPMVGPQARATTLRLVPRSGAGACASAADSAA
jgi:hypothetical protein